MIRSLSRAAVCLLAAFSLSATPTLVGTWNFDGVCSDCPGHGTGVLNVYNSGVLNFQFSYSSAWISYSLNNATAYDLSGPITGTVFTGPPAFFGLSQAGAALTSFGGVGNPLAAGVYTTGLTVEFVSLADGRWSTGPNMDFGDAGSGVWTVANNTSGVPEPTTMAMAALGAVAVAGGVRRRRQNQA